MGKERLAKAVEKFRKQYPTTTSADLQSFSLGFQAAEKSISEDIMKSLDCFKQIPEGYRSPGDIMNEKAFRRYCETTVKFIEES